MFVWKCSIHIHVDTSSIPVKGLYYDADAAAAADDGGDFLYFFGIFKGETSSGKSTIMNLILGMKKKIVPKSITPSTSRVCRIRYSDSLTISTLDEKEKEIQQLLLRDEDAMAKSLESLATNQDDGIVYVDIGMPLPILKVFHVICINKGLSKVHRRS